MFSPPVSPDGALIAYGRTDGQGASAKSKFVVQRLEGGAIVQGDRDACDLQLASARVDAGWARAHLRAQYDREYAERLHAAAGWRRRPCS